MNTILNSIMLKLSKFCIPATHKLFESEKWKLFEKNILVFLDIRIFPTIFCLICLTFLVVKSYSPYKKKDSQSISLNLENNSSILIGPIFFIFLKYAILGFHIYQYYRNNLVIPFPNTLKGNKITYISFGILDVIAILGLLSNGCVSVSSRTIINILPFMYLFIIRLFIAYGKIKCIFPVIYINLLIGLFSFIEIVIHKNEILKFFTKKIQKITKKLSNK